MAKEPEGKITMNKTVAATNSTKTATSAKKFAFTFDHVHKKSVGKDVDFQKAGIPGSKLEEELLARMDARPNYTFAIIETAKKPAKQSYEGLTMEVMEEYLNLVYEGELAAEARAKFAEMKEKKEQKKLAYPTIKSWFLDMFPKFNVNKAKMEIKAKKLESAKAPYKVVKTKKVKATPAVMELPAASNF